MKILAILKAVGGGIIKELPMIGGILHNIKEKNEAKAGKLSKTQFAGQIMYYVFAGLIFLQVTGNLNMETVKDTVEVVTSIMNLAHPKDSI